MSHIKLGKRQVNPVDIIANNDRPSVMWFLAIGLITVLLLFPLMASPIVGISIVQGYFFYVLQILFFGFVNSTIRMRALTLIARKANTDGN